MPVRAVLTNLIRLICLGCILALAFASGRYLREPTLDGGIVLLVGIVVCAFVIIRLVGPGGVAAFTPARDRAPGEAAPPDAAPAARRAPRVRGGSRHQQRPDGPPREPAATEPPRGKREGPRERARREAERAREAITEPPAAAGTAPPLWDPEPAPLPARGAEPVPDTEPPGARGSSEPLRPAAAPSGRINVNTASVEELAALRGVGPVAAERIVAERQANGPFASLEALTRVEGFAGSRIARIRAQGVVAE